MSTGRPYQRHRRGMLVLWRPPLRRSTLPSLCAECFATQRRPSFDHLVSADKQHAEVAVLRFDHQSYLVGACTGPNGGAQRTAIMLIKIILAFTLVLAGLAIAEGYSGHLHPVSSLASGGGNLIPLL